MRRSDGPSAPASSADLGSGPGGARDSRWAVLGGTRFVLALIVVGSHLTAFAPMTPWMQASLRLSAFAAVVGFLMISGYSIAHSLARNRIGYLRRRFWRIVPLYWLALATGVAVLAALPSPLHAGRAVFWPRPGGWQVAGNAVMLQGVFVARIDGLGQFWTLSIEEGLYLLAPFLFRLRHGWLAAIVLASAGFFVLHAATGVTVRDMTFGLGVPAMAWAWVAGFLYYRKPAVPALALLVAVPSVMLLAWDENAGGFGWVTVAATGILLALAPRIHIKRRWIETLLSLLGDVSYPLYLVHLTLFTLTAFFGVNLDGLVFLIVALGASTVLVVSVDRPLRRRFRDRGEQAPSPTLGGTASRQEV